MQLPRNTSRFWTSTTLLAITARSRPKRVGEPAWHRRQRRLRTSARTHLRNLVSGVETFSTRSHRAIQALRSHHSGSQLVVQLEKQLAAGAMATNTNQPWKCGKCHIWNKMSAHFCPGCGKPWQKVMEKKSGGPSGHEDWQEAWPPKRDPSQRGRRRKSPRGQQPLAFSRGNQESLPMPPRPPTPPEGKGNKAKPTLVNPTPPPAPDSGGTAEARLLEVLAALTLHQDRLPDDLRTLVASQQAADAASQAKALHRQVAAHTGYAKQLSTLKSQRVKYIQGWANYVTGLAKTFGEQVEKKSKVLADFQEKEDSLRQLAEAARTQFLSLAEKSCQIPEKGKAWTWMRQGKSAPIRGFLPETWKSPKRRSRSFFVRSTTRRRTPPRPSKGKGPGLPAGPQQEWRMWRTSPLPATKTTPPGDRSQTVAFLLVAYLQALRILPKLVGEPLGTPRAARSASVHMDTLGL